MTVIGVHSTMHPMHPNYYHIIAYTITMSCTFETAIVYPCISSCINTFLWNIISNIDWHFSQIRYQFEISNTLGSVKRCVVLVIHEGEGEDGINIEQNFESNPVSQPEFGEYVASLHSCNNSTFILQYEVSIILSLYKTTHIIVNNTSQMQ